MLIFHLYFIALVIFCLHIWVAWIQRVLFLIMKFLQGNVLKEGRRYKFPFITSLRVSLPGQKLMGHQLTISYIFWPTWAGRGYVLSPCQMPSHKISQFRLRGHKSVHMCTELNALCKPKQTILCLVMAPCIFFPDFVICVLRSSFSSRDGYQWHKW